MTLKRDIAPLVGRSFLGAAAIYPDCFANEERWGLTTVQLTSRAAYNTLAALYTAN